MAKKKVKEEAVVSENQAVSAATEAATANLAPAPEENSIAYKLLSLYHLQCIYSDI